MTDDTQQSKWVILSVSVPPDMAEALKRLAKENDRSVSAELRQAIAVRLREAELA